jgi:hypothetical protein
MDPNEMFRLLTNFLTTHQQQQQQQQQRAQANFIPPGGYSHQPAPMMTTQYHQPGTMHQGHQYAFAGQQPPGMMTTQAVAAGGTMMQLQGGTYITPGHQQPGGQQSTAPAGSSMQFQGGTYITPGHQQTGGHVQSAPAPGSSMQFQGGTYITPGHQQPGGHLSPAPQFQHQQQGGAAHGQPNN